ncbi:SMUG2 DNA glycosylase family protein [Flavobacterium dauae]|uniref:SMUG2 DNA glycosylase family protein n=1 Tax=Flavobacterium dauae TaxID=1563479 RepID=UPI00101B4BF3|nr:SMUG2 DNA glycosylase family protein [Flavobacterium dauae]WLD22792.1 SMUG2 DNA glycosylase family protein [Flavobacterium dauae]
MSFADKIITFNTQLKYEGNLPEGFQVLNPYVNNPETLKVMRQFYYKYYNDNNRRKFIIGINPSRNGAGVTGIPFTDTKRLKSVCGIEMTSAHTHEISSVFLYDVIEAFDGAEKFYNQFYINSPFPLAIIQNIKGNNWVNANYYDEASLFNSVKDFMIASLKNHISFGLNTNEVFVLGVKNARFIKQINNKEKLFNKITVLEHPRYIQQYKLKEKQLFIDKYLMAFKGF